MAARVNWDLQHEFPAELFEVEAGDLHRVLSGPTLFDLRRADKQPFFVATLLHGNEQSGWDAVRKFLRETPNASLVLLVGNVAAAAANMRHLLDEPDFNRIWRQPPWAELLNDLLRDVNPWCGIDIHNNSGPNPHYSVVTNLEDNTLALASLFSDKLIFTSHTLDILGHAIAQHCPTLTIETGSVADPSAVTRTYDLLKRLDALGRVPTATCRALRSYETLGIVKAESQQDGFANYPVFAANLAHMSFKELSKDSVFAECIAEPWRLSVSNPSSELDFTEEYFERRNGKVVLKQNVVLSMFTSDPLLASQDCVCYLLRELNDLHG
ncbi:MAG: hypothetical protein F4W90_11830 [Gammaproteobacteria bacterium]|nr:hypothetical protein [Gammaproteobacteria bacterium]